ncbi:MAG: hypothetical protein PUC18_11165 [Prevotellaceae bacterium]|nr:hypothetical protein [Prevotellaceae bacterium]
MNYLNKDDDRFNRQQVTGKTTLFADQYFKNHPDRNQNIWAQAMYHWAIPTRPVARCQRQLRAPQHPTGTVALPARPPRPPRQHRCAPLRGRLRTDDGLLQQLRQPPQRRLLCPPPHPLVVSQDQRRQVEHQPPTAHAGAAPAASLSARCS